ncbi:uncharacterized protein LOC144362084 [Saccoglossus kowalevskii]
MKSSGFNLRSWSSNCKEIRALAEKDNALEMNTNLGILGIRWQTDSDVFSIKKLTGHNPDHRVTKRYVTKVVSRKPEWDEPLADIQTKKWEEIISDVVASTDIMINRKYFTDHTKSTDVHKLHVFVDASPKAYGAAVYLRQDRQTSLVISKTRVAPLKEMKLPRLERMAALIGSRLIRFVSHALKDKINITKHVLWSDIHIVIHWIRSEKRLPRFVANRIKEINEFPCDVKYCPINENPTDLITRGISAESLMKSDIWWLGPT